jgi:hypothetical protein
MSILILRELTMNANYIIRITRPIPTRLLSANLFMYERVTHPACGSFFGRFLPPPLEGYRMPPSTHTPPIHSTPSQAGHRKAGL